MPSARLAEKIAAALALADRLLGAGDATNAAKACRLILELDPGHAGASYRLGRIAESGGDRDAAALYFARAAVADPADPRYPAALARLLRRAGRGEEALAILDDAVRHHPGAARLLYQRGLVLLSLGRSGAAEADFAAIAAADPADADAWNGLGAARLARNALDEAAAAFRQSLALRPDSAKAAKNLAYALSAAGRRAEADAVFEVLRRQAPDFTEARMDEAIHRLSFGDFSAGWDMYEARWLSGVYGERDWGFGLPRWSGERVGSGRVLFWGEQGIGDQVLYGTQLGDAVAALGGEHVAVAVTDRLVPLVRRGLAGTGAVVVARGDRVGDAVAQCPFGSLGRYYRRDAGSFAGKAGRYLGADPARVAALRLRYGGGQKLIGQKLIGVAWRSANPEVGAQKSLDLEALVPLLRLPGVRFVSVQYGDVASEVALLRDRHGIDLVVDGSIDPLKDLEGHGAQLAALDGVVSVSNTAVHLAGALGVRCWVLLAAGRGRLWYWPREGEASLWYGSVRLLRQDRAGDWGGVVDRAAREVAGL